MNVTIKCCLFVTLSLILYLIIVESSLIPVHHMRFLGIRYYRICRNTPCFESYYIARKLFLVVKILLCPLSPHRAKSLHKTHLKCTIVCCERISCCITFTISWDVFHYSGSSLSMLYDWLQLIISFSFSSIELDRNQNLSRLLEQFSIKYNPFKIYFYNSAKIIVCICYEFDLHLT